MFLPWNIFIIKIFLNNVRSYLKNYIDNSSSLQRTGAGNSQLKQTSSGNRTNFVETFSLVYRLHLEYWSHSVWDCNYLRTHVNTYVQLFRHPPSEKKMKSVTLECRFNDFPVSYSVLPTFMVFLWHHWFFSVNAEISGQRKDA